MAPPDSGTDILPHLLAYHRDDDLEAALHHAAALLALAETHSVALEDLGIELPPASGGTPADQAHLRAIAALYLAAELERAMLVPAAEMLAGLAATGGLPGAGDLGQAAGRILAELWHGRHQRMTEAERHALFAGLFGDASDPRTAAHFDLLLIDLCEALFKLDEDAGAGPAGGIAQQVRLHGAAGRLADELLRRSGTATMFVAKDVLATVRTALALFKQHPVQAVFGAPSTWAAVSAVVQRYLHASAEAETHVNRAKDGVTILAWLADMLPHVAEPAHPLATLTDPVIAAAAEWLQTSLALSERATGEHATVNAGG